MWSDVCDLAVVEENKVDGEGWMRVLDETFERADWWRNLQFWGMRMENIWSF
jgi:hypothetical protein